MDIKIGIFINEILKTLNESYKSFEDYRIDFENENFSSNKVQLNPTTVYKIIKKNTRPSESSLEIIKSFIIEKSTNQTKNGIIVNQNGEKVISYCCSFINNNDNHTSLKDILDHSFKTIIENDENLKDEPISPLVYSLKQNSTKKATFNKYSYLKNKLLCCSKSVYNDMCTVGGRYSSLKISSKILPNANSFFEVDVKVNNIENMSIDQCIQKISSSQNWNSVLIGEGGMGKTVSLLNLWKQYLSNKNYPIPIYIQLSEYNNLKDDKEKFIINKILTDYLDTPKPLKKDENLLWNFLRRAENGVPSIILLLDGYNEINSKRDGLIIELWKIIEKLRGVQLIITSRYDLRASLSLNNFNKLELLYLKDSQIKDFLADNNKFNNLSPRLLNVLKTPMFLTLFTASCSYIEKHAANSLFHWKRNTQRPGEIFWNFIESHLAKKYEDSANIKNTYFHALLLKFLLPYIGWKMENKNVYYISRNELFNTINEACDTFQSDLFFNTFEKYALHGQELNVNKTTFLLKFRYNKIESILVDELNLIIKKNNSYRFLHQHFRDYFSAVHIINECMLSVESKKIPSVISKKPLSYQVRRFIGEIENEYTTSPGFKDRITMGGLINNLRNIFDGSIGYSIWNILSIVKDFRLDISGINLSNLDMTRVSLNSLICSRIDKNKLISADFSGIKINDENIFQQGHLNCINNASFSSDGKIFITSSSDKSIKLWDIESSKCINTLYGHTDIVSSAHFSVDGKKIISASYDKSIKIWDFITLKPIKTIFGHNDFVRNAVYNHDCSKILSSSDDGSINLWNGSDYSFIQCIKTEQSNISCIEFSPNGKLIIYASNAEIKILNSYDFKFISYLKGHLGNIRSISFNPIGTKIASASDDCTIKIWDSDSYKCIGTLKGHTNSVRSVKFNSNGKKIISSSTDKTIKIWDSVTYKCIYTLNSHNSPVSCAVFSPDNSKIISTSYDNTIKIWDTSSFECIYTLNVHLDYVRYAVFSPDKNRIVTSSSDNTIKIWDFNSKTCLYTIVGHSDWINSALYSNDSSRLVSCSNDNTVKIWDSNTYECLKTLTSHSDYVSFAAFSPDDKKIISASYDKSIKIWDSKTYKCLKTLTGHKDYIRSISFSHKCKKLASASDDKTIKIWDLKSYKCINTLKGHTDYVRSAVFSPDNRKLVSSSSDHSIKIWDLDTGLCISTLKGHYDAVRSISFSNNGQSFISTSSDNTIKIWDFNTLRCIQTLKGHSNSIRNASFSPDDRYIVSASYDNTVKIWDSQSYKCISTLVNVSGIFMHGCKLTNLHKDSNLSKNCIQILKMYGLILDNSPK